MIHKLITCFGFYENWEKRKNPKQTHLFSFRKRSTSIGKTRTFLILKMTVLPMVLMTSLFYLEGRKILHLKAPSYNSWRKFVQAFTHTTMQHLTCKSDLSFLTELILLQRSRTFAASGWLSWFTRKAEVTVARQKLRYCMLDIAPLN